ncbi:MAG: disulfide bond formation protein B [Hyphomicrobiales bacterium]
MHSDLSRLLNSLGLIAVSLVLAVGFYFQFVRDELPCPLCLLQRVGLAMVGVGLVLNIVCGPRPSHYAVMIISALFGMSVAVRQVLLHIVPGTGTYGSPVFGLHYYTWSVLLFLGVLIGTAFMLLFDRQYENASGNNENKPRVSYGNNGLERAAVIFLMIIIGANVVSTFLECGPLVCADNPVEYKLLN